MNNIDIIPTAPISKKRERLPYLTDTNFVSDYVQSKKIYNVNFLFTPDLSEVLMIHKNRGPYSNTINGVGGKFDKILDSVDSCSMFINMGHSAVREIKEETDVTVTGNLHFVLCEIFPPKDAPEWRVDLYTELWVFCGVIDKENVHQLEDEKLEWYKTDDLIKMGVNEVSLAGDGNIPYFINLCIQTIQRQEEGETNIGK